MGSALRQGLVHEALVYSSAEELLARAVPFLLDGVRAGQSTLAVLPPDKLALVEAELGGAAADVEMLDASTLYGSPAATIAAYSKVLDDHDDGGLRVLAEAQFGPSVTRQAAWTRYESIVNHTFAGRPAWIICAYDRRELPAHVVAYAPCTHEFVSEGGERSVSTAYLHPDELVARPLAAAGRASLADPLERLTVRDEQSAEQANRIVESDGRAAGLDAETVADLVVVLSELVQDAISRGDAEILTGFDGPQWVCDVTVPAPASHVGVSIARLIGAGIELFTEPDRETVRLRFARRR